jgi:mannopine transport system ATP-binding protein
MKSACVAVRDLSKSYGPATAVSGVSINVRAGEFLSLLGPSGSGKTTLLMMIAGFEAPTAGAIHIDDRDITELAPNKRNIGMVFQRYALFPHMSVADNIAFPLRMRRTPKAELRRRVEAALALVRLENYGNRLPGQLSGGQQQRVAVARALVFEPPVMLMDEPLGALDKNLREQMQIEIKRIQRRVGVTVIYVTHDQEEALTMSDRIAILDEGRLAQVGTPIELYDQPGSPFVASFIGKMNFLDGEYLGTDGGDMMVRLPSDARFAVPKEGYQNGRQLCPGDGLRVALRPERLKLKSRGEGGPFAIPGTIEATIFVGSFHVFLVRVAGTGTELLHVQLPPGSGGLHFKHDDEVDLVAEPAAIRVFSSART